MKFIHTADWHLGKLLKEHAMTEDQEWLLMHRFLPLVDEERPDVILLSGDVYDRSYPPEEAVELFDRMTEEIVGKRHTPLIVISGNHDSAERLAVASRLLSHQGLYIFGPLDRVHPVILEDAWGKVAFVPLPYAEPARVRGMMNQKGLSGAEDIHSYEEAAKKLSEILLSALPDPSMRKVALAHVFAAGGTPSESERPLSIGGYDRISDSVFDAYDYAALGHLHRHQRTQMQSERVQYSGSLMRVQLAVGLPPAHFGVQAKRFINYFNGRGAVAFQFKGKPYAIFIENTACFPQSVSAAAATVKNLASFPRALVVDIGGFTADYVRLRNGVPDMAACDSLENGVILLYNRICAKANAELDILLEESEIDRILRGEDQDAAPEVIALAEREAQEFSNDLLSGLRERMLELKSGKVIFLGGGATLLRRQIEASGKIGQAIFVEDINANAKGYEYLYRLQYSGR